MFLLNLLSVRSAADIILLEGIAKRVFSHVSPIVESRSMSDMQDNLIVVLWIIFRFCFCFCY